MFLLVTCVSGIRLVVTGLMGFSSRWSRLSSRLILVSYDFITKLLLTANGHDSICVFVDRLTKMAYFAPCNETITAKGFAKLYIDTVQVQQNLSKTFVF